MTELGPAFVAGAAAGLGVAIPFGPIGIIIVETSLRRGWAAGAAAGMGAATIDGIYAFVAAFAGAAVAGLVEPVAIPIRVVSAVVLAAIAIRGLLILRHRARVVVGDLGPSLPRTYLTIVGLTAINPLTIVYFTALVVGLPALGSTAAKLSFSAGAAIGSGVWQLTISGVAALFHRRLTETARVVTGVVGDLIILGLAANILRSVVGL